MSAFAVTYNDCSLLQIAVVLTVGPLFMTQVTLAIFSVHVSQRAVTCMH